MRILALPYFLGSMLLVISACSDSPSAQKDTKEHPENSSENRANPVYSVNPELFPDKIQLFSLLVHEDCKEENKTLTCFISLSEVLNVGEDSDKEHFFPLANSEADTLERISIEGNYRRSLLKEAGITEKNAVYLYNYAADKLVVIPVSRLKSMAFLNGYSGRGDAPFEEYLYHVGFQFDSNILDQLKTHYGNQVVVYIGTENPFIRGKMQPVKWKKRKDIEWPGNQSASYLKQFKSLKKNNPLSYKTDTLTYWVRDWGTNEFYREKRELVVVNESGKIVYTKLLVEDEGCSIEAANGQYPDFYQKQQFVGELIKDAGPTFIGFESYSFSCELFRFLQFPKNQIVLNCDSRH